MDWTAVTIAGGFVIGTVFGAFLVIRITRIVWDAARGRSRLTPPRDRE